MNFPRDRSQYVLDSADLTPDGATIHRAKHPNPATGKEVDVGIKITDIDKIDDFSTFFRHQHSVGKVYCSFITEKQLWLITPPPPQTVPIRSIMRSGFRRGLPEKAVFFILKETLKFVHHMHDVKNLVCRNICAGSVLLDSNYAVKIPMSSITADSGFVKDYELEEINKERDVLMFGFLALELFYGMIPSSEEFSLLVANEFGLDHKLEKIRVFSCFRGETRRVPPKALAEVMAACLCREPAERPTTAELMKYKLFQTKFSGSRCLRKLMNKK